MGRSRIFANLANDRLEADRYNQHKLDVFREAYWRELELRQEITRNTTFLSAVVTIVFGAGSFLIEKRISKDPLILNEVDFLIFSSVGFTFIFGVIAVWYIVRVMHGRTYEYIPDLARIENFLDASRKYYSYWAPQRLNEKLNKDFHNLINQYMVKCTSNNRENNIERAAARFKAFRYSIFSVAALLVAFALFVLSEARHFVSESRICGYVVEVRCQDASALREASEGPAAPKAGSATNGSD